MSTLVELAEKYGVDKLHNHSYLSLYEQLFTARVVHRLLEIGVGYEDLMKPFVPFYVHGASLKMWADYFPHADIFSCDIRPETLINEGRIYSVVCDQSSPAQLDDMAQGFGGTDEPFDVIIDDGSHQPEHQILTARVLLPYLRDGGVYVIEDVRDARTAGEIFTALVPYAVRKRGSGINVHHFAKRPDDILVVIEK